MNPLAFLVLALVLSIIGIIAVWIRHRESDAPDSTIDEFRSKMRALSEQEELSRGANTPGPDERASGAPRPEAGNSGGALGDPAAPEVRDIEGPTGRGDATRRGG